MDYNQNPEREQPESDQPDAWTLIRSGMAKMSESVVAAEREACAKVADNMGADLEDDEDINIEIASKIAAAIRARRTPAP